MQTHQHYTTAQHKKQRQGMPLTLVIGILLLSVVTAVVLAFPSSFFPPATSTANRGNTARTVGATPPELQVAAVPPSVSPQNMVSPPTNSSFTTMPTTSPRQPSTADTPSDLEGKPFAAIQAVIRAKINDQVYLGGDVTNTVMFVMHVAPDVQQERSTELTAGDEVAFTGTIERVPDIGTMQTQWNLEREHAEKLHATAKWYVSIENIAPHDEIDTQGTRASPIR